MKLIVKTNLLFIFVLLVKSTLFADFKITRGPDIGEIYYIGPTATGEGIYHSTDFGQTATCVDSTLNTNILFMSICADLTPGVLYGFSMPENLYISYDYGNEGSWIFRASNVSYQLFSGITEGFLYNGFWQHSEDYGSNFIQHSYNGYFGSSSCSELDAEQNIGFIRSVLGDSIYFFISYDNFENLELQSQFNYFSENISILTRGFETGKLFAFGGFNSELRFSNDFGESFELKNNLISYSSITGGRQPGELYVLGNYTQLMGEIKHTYIHHSLDYGETFEMYHPFSHGPDPYYSNFEATPLEGSAPLTVQFTDLSSGDNIQTWEWDFNLDGTIDSYEQNPEYTFQDTGYYSIKLKIYFDVLEDGYVKSNYIHVTNGNGIDNKELEITNYQLNNYPNPFNPNTIIKYELHSGIKNPKIEIYNLKGQLIDEIFVDNNDNSTEWNAEGLASGIYFYKLNIKNSSIKKMMLLK